MLQIGEYRGVKTYMMLWWWKKSVIWLSIMWGVVMSFWKEIRKGKYKEYWGNMSIWCIYRSGSIRVYKCLYCPYIYAWIWLCIINSSCVCTYMPLVGMQKVFFDGTRCNEDNWSWFDSCVNILFFLIMFLLVLKFIKCLWGLFGLLSNYHNNCW